MQSVPRPLRLSVWDGGCQLDIANRKNSYLSTKAYSYQVDDDCVCVCPLVELVTFVLIEAGKRNQYDRVLS
jgi:hypothetical protein